MKYDQSINPHKLYKDSKNGYIAGVLAGLAAYLGISAAIIRILFIIALIINAPLMIILYIVFAFVLDKKPTMIFNNPEEEVFWRGVSASPRNTSTELRHRFLKLDQRLQKLEDYVTSDSFELNNKIHDL